ncbi:sulfonate transport system substrate-binding protein [Gracilibacillus halotolerans]|uniref:Putative aliphatic sulfonates-binding protein n=1 Tax=Gracilibacillus halotolerans TaxID=74386 RepID=A0A841RML8_9BACI|nr:aliphatic sulfonate ABC transporter substrate-binding protein [Gracilibacillus halotolerans]MBB6513739.1 sulfonate transport system substrate-binding protein [Gracilibacillus halotolerans]
MERIPLIDWRSFIVILLLGIIIIFTAGCGTETSAEEELSEIRLDYAYYSPTSLVLKKFGWVEEAYEEEGTEVVWTLSQGSNKALEYLNSNSVDFGSTAGAAALISKANGAPIQNVYIYSKPEWTALVTTEDSDIKTVADLKGKQVAATLGTDPYIFLVRALAEEGLSVNDITVTNLQHADGATALVNGDVDAWSGLDPHMAKYEVENNTPLFFRNIDFNTYGFLNVREEFAEKHPEHVKRIIELYEKARQWVLDNPEEAAELLAEEAGIDLEVAKIQMERNDFSNAIPGDVHLESIKEAGRVLQEADVLNDDVDVEETANNLIEPKFSEEVIGGQ